MAKAVAVGAAAGETPKQVAHESLPSAFPRHWRLTPCPAIRIATGTVARTIILQSFTLRLLGACINQACTLQKVVFTTAVTKFVGVGQSLLGASIRRDQGRRLMTVMRRVREGGRRL